MESIKELPVLIFGDQLSWHNWLEENHNQTKGVWLKIAKKSSGKTSVSYDNALKEALCYGWIDGQKQSYDNEYWLQKFTPRGTKSIWSKVNVIKAEELIKSGMMQTPGSKAIELAKKDGRWKSAYDSPSVATVPIDFQKALEENPKAKQFFETLNKANTYAIYWRIHTAKKSETRKARIKKFIDMLNRGEKLH